MAKNRYVGEYPVIGIRPIIDGRRGPMCQVKLHDVSTFSDSATSLGAAAAAGVGIGLYGSLPEAAAHIAVSSTFEPNPETQAVYALTKKRYAMLYPSLVEAFHTRA